MKLTQQQQTTIFVSCTIISMTIGTIVLLIYLAVTYIWSDKVRIKLVNEPIDGRETHVIENALADIKTTRMYSGTFCFWLYLKSMSNMQTTKTNYIMSYEIPISEYGTNAFFDVIYGDIGDTTNNRLTIRVKDSENNVESFYVADINLQKWMCVEIVIKDLRMDIYIDGQLINSKLLKYVPLLSDQGTLYIGKDNGFNGLIGNLTFFNYALSEDDVVKYYKQGNY
jgi:hypothetical protein